MINYKILFLLSIFLISICNAEMNIEMNSSIHIKGIGLYTLDYGNNTTNESNKYIELNNSLIFKEEMFKWRN